MRTPTNATECASVAPVARPCPEMNTRARADSFGGGSATFSPALVRRSATCPPIPAQPSVAHTCFFQWAT